MVHIIFDLKICKQHHRSVRGQKDQNMSGTMEVGEAHTGPPGAEHPVIHPASNCQHPQCDGPTAQADHAQVVLHLQLHHQQAEGGDTQGQQDECIHNLTKTKTKKCCQTKIICMFSSLLLD